MLLDSHRSRDSKRKPNLFIIGAMKSGTSSLCSYIAEHPDIFMSHVREPMHFSRDENWRRGHAEYLELFSDAADQAYVAEGSTEYTKRPFREGVATRIHEFNPDARLVYVMREPFSRLVSQYRHQVRRGRERGSLEQALSSRSDYLTNSYYAYQLKPYLEVFGRRAVYLDTFESMVTAPVAFCARLFEWLEIDGSFVPSRAGERLNVSPRSIELLDEDSLRVRGWRLLRQNTSLRQVVPAFLRRWYKALLPRKYRHVDSEEFQQQLHRVRRNLEPLLAEWISELAELTGRSYDEWPSGRPGMPLQDAVREQLELLLPEIFASTRE